MTGECRHPLLSDGEIQSIQAASVRGSLFHLGGYPGMVLAGTSDVRGELIEFRDLPSILPLLDEEEGSEYRRELVTAVLRSGDEVVAWSYVLPGEPADRALISSGNWRSASSIVPPSVRSEEP